MIFISHRNKDEERAVYIKKYCDKCGVDSYIDVLDPEIRRADDITKHIVGQLTKCSHLIVVFSVNTQGSMWVPFELGAAYADQKGIGTFIYDNVKLPEYLDAFPRMKSEQDLNQYINIYKTDRSLKRMFESKNYEAAAYKGSDVFIKDLKTRLGQL